MQRIFERFCTIGSAIDFKFLPKDISQLDLWIADKFIEGLEKNQNLEDLYERKSLEGVFGNDLKKRRGVYGGLTGQALEQQKTSDLAKWIDDKQYFARQICRYILGDRREEDFNLAICD